MKNLLVLAAPVAAGTLLESGVLAATALAFFAFTLAASATYLMNDVLDVEGDRMHPVKRTRPIAAGVVSARLAITTSVVVAVTAVVLPVVLGAHELAAVVGAYLLVQATYISWAKHQPVFDIACIATGFVLRAVAGGVASDVPLTSSFLTVTAAVAMFVVAGKRHSELASQGGDSSTRPVLDLYSENYLRFVWGTSLGIAVVFYVLWAVDLSVTGGGLWADLSTVPFTLLLLRYAMNVDAGTAEDPEVLVFHDRALQVLGLAWAAMFVAQVALR